MTRIPRIFIPALVTARGYYLVHDLNEFIFLESSILALVTLTPTSKPWRFLALTTSVVAFAAAIFLLTRQYFASMQTGYVFGVMILSLVGTLTGCALFLAPPLDAHRQQQNKRRKRLCVLLIFCLGSTLIDGLILQYVDAALPLSCPYFVGIALIEGGRMCVALGKEEERRARIELEHVADASRQAVHDIRSPLTALSLLSSGTDSTEPQKQKLLRMTIERIEGIANSLSRSAIATRLERCAPSILPEFCEQIIQEKMIKIDSVDDLKINTFCHPNVYSSSDFVLVSKTDLQRAISNLVDNAIEATGLCGAISLRIDIKYDRLAISVTDSGTGMTDEVKRRAGTPGFSTKNSTGRGLGIAQARNAATNANGTLAISSQVGVGTTVTLEFPLLKV
jgi:signal transduction histidine kinase